MSEGDKQLLSPLLQQLEGIDESTSREGVKLIERIEYTSFLELLHEDSDSPALIDASFTRNPLTHRCLVDFIRNDFRLDGVRQGSRVCVCLTNSPELGTCFASLIANGFVVFPLNPAATAAEMKWEVSHTQCDVVIFLESDDAKSSKIDAAISLHLSIYVLIPSSETTGLFELLPYDAKNKRNGHDTDESSEHDQLKRQCSSNAVLLLFTSGTSGHKKLVPYSLKMLVTGVACIIASWKLQASDVCMNMMPLFHIGGIMRNLMSPLLSGGAAIVCNGFDPVLFWDTLETFKFTWYYAAPTMHHAILQEASARYKDEFTRPPTESVRFVANAAGGLLPVLANNLREVFDATILTSYGMTECMPISSPPLSYTLNPIGTSGKAVGPRICIVSDDMISSATSDESLSSLVAGQVGSIMVKGAPCFTGYEVPPGESSDHIEKCFYIVDKEKGWFCTGDCGYLNTDGYLFITGRSKEIINRGGETISPYEIEEAIIQHPKISDVLAFAAPHETLQECVGVVVVSPPNSPRVDLQSLWDFLEEQQQLHRSKWPSVIVFMNALPRNAANKLLRVKLGQRFKLNPVSDENNYSSLTRLFQGKCPPLGSPLSLSIPITSIKDCIQNELTSMTEVFIQNIEGVSSVAVTLLDSPLRKDTIIAFVTPDDVDADMIKQKCEEGLHRYLCPTLVHACKSLIDSFGNDKSTGSINVSTETALSIIQSTTMSTAKLPSTEIEVTLEAIWRRELNLPVASIVSKDQTFFSLGGDSLRAGRLVSIMRKEFRVPLTVADLFAHPTIASFANQITRLKRLKDSDSDTDEFGSNDLEMLEIESHTLDTNYMSLLMPNRKNVVTPESPKDKSIPTDMNASHLDETQVDKVEEADTDEPDYEYSMKYDNASITTLSTQLLPLALFFPLRRLLMWFVIAWSWLLFMNIFGIHRFPALLLAMAVTRLVRGFILPLVAVLFKWIVIGKYKPGRYPLFGAMYLKWWIVEQIFRVCGKGYFGDDRLPIIGTSLVRLYYTMLGAQIGQNVAIHPKAKIGQPDLLIIGDDVSIDEATVRPFALEEGHMILLPIVIGDNCSVGVKSIISPGAVVSSNTHIGPLSSSHEMKDSSPSNRSYCRPTLPKPPSYLVFLLGYPLMAFVALISYLPWIVGLKIMLVNAKSHGWYDKDLLTFYDVFTWWLKPQRLVYYFSLRIIHKVVVPPFQLLAIVFIKRFVVGKFEHLDSAEERARPFNAFKYWIMSELLPGGNLAGVSKLIGSHYELISMVYRALGAKVGKRVYWPGTGIDVVEMDLLDIGDDVVFGSRSVFMPSSSDRACTITIGDGAMVADRCVLLPGATLGKACVLGSGGLAREGFEGGIGSMWVGSRAGTTTMVQPEDESYLLRDLISPFGKAFYQGKADYFVFPLWFVAFYNTFWQALCVCYRHTPLMLSMFLAYHKGSMLSFVELFQKSFSVYIPLNLAMAVFALLFDVATKWAIIGRREPGLYSWDRSSYCQRWQLHLTFQELRRGELQNNGLLDFLAGSQYLVWYFRAMGCSIGPNVCLFPNGGDPMMTEPDLVEIGKGSCIDDAYLISHINTRGVFRLNKIIVGNYCVLKTYSRLLSGSGMEDNAILLEHTLVISGENVEKKGVRQGWPILTHLSLEEHRMGLLKMLSVQDLDLTSLYLSSNSVSTLKSMKRRHHKKNLQNSEYEMLPSDSSHHEV